MSSDDDVVRLAGGTPVGKVAASWDDVEADGDEASADDGVDTEAAMGPFHRVWFSRMSSRDYGLKFHDSASCAAQNQRGPIPSFLALADDADAEPCGTCAKSFRRGES